MPQVKPIRIHSASPSHEKYPPKNLIQSSGADKKLGWKCRDQGEKKAHVVLELAEPTVINGIDIGNEHSCFIEVLVGQKGDLESDFKELLLTSSFQTPTESRNSENTNRVRCFSKAAFVEGTAEKKWELIKLVCTQPFNSRVQYGVSFVTIYTPEGQEKEVAKPVPLVEVKKKAIFSLREESPESDADLNSGSLFSRWKQSKQSGSEGTAATATPPRVTAAAAIRDARSSTGERNRSPLLLTPTVAKKRPSSDTPVLDRNRNNLLYDDEDEKEGDAKLEQLIEKDKKRAEEQLKKEAKTPRPEKEKPAEGTPAKKFKFSDNKRDDGKATPSRSREQEPTEQPRKERPKRPKQYKPFRKLLEGVVLTISGIQNPERGDLRSKALEMGAKYRADWDDTCTHLICAFRNTPKYNQVQGVGKIVRKDWVLQCHANRKHIPWRRYALDNKEADKSESEGEICDEKERDSLEPTEEEATSAAKVVKVDDDDDDLLMVYDQVDQVPVVICDSGSDTEDEIEKVQAKAKEPVKEDAEKEKVEGKADTATGFWSGKKFFLDEDNGAIKIIKCHSIITKYGGDVIESKEAADYWIKSSAPSAEFLTSSAKLPVARPLWLEESADMECLVPIKRYLY